MALSETCLEVFAREAIPLVVKRDRCMIFGYPRINDQVLQSFPRIFGIEASSFIDLLLKIGFQEVVVADVSAYEGCDKLIDLNKPVVLDEVYDLLIDNGTLEHCFNISQAFFNVKTLLSVGGVVFHLNPANWVGHGFWNFSPCVYHDFYNANGFTCDTYLRRVSSPRGYRYRKIEYKPKVTKILPQYRYTFHAVAFKHDLCPDVIPMQQRYVVKNDWLD